MASFTVDSIRERANKKYASVEIQLSDGSSVTLLNPLRLEKSKRKALIDAQKSIADSGDEDDVDQEQFFENALRLVASDHFGAERLIGELGGDLSLLAEVFAIYTDGTSAGEASASQD